MLNVFIFSLIGGIFSWVGGILLLSRKTTALKLAKFATPFAAGALLGAVFLDLLPEGTAEGNAETVFTATLIGIILFFIAERVLWWFHHHHEDEKFNDPSKWLIIIGDTAHNALDGVAIAAAFLINTPTGIITTFAVAAHEIPQEIGDFGLLLSKGMQKSKILFFNAFSALATTVTAVLTYSIGSEESLPISAMLGISAGFLLYVALSDLIPTIHDHAKRKKVGIDSQTYLLVAGTITVYLAINLVGRFVSEGH